MLFSFIVPVYNVEEYLPQCLNSILGQTHQNIEVVIIDDGSSDQSPQIADEYAQRDVRVKVIHKVNEGVSVARNVGLSLCTGDYIIYVDSDDYVAPDLCAQISKILETKPNIDIIQFDFQKINNVALKTPTKSIIVPQYFSAKEALAQMIAYGIFRHEAWGKVLKKSLVSQCPFPRGIFMAEDLVFIYQCFGHAQTCAYLNMPLYFLRIRENSAMHSTSKKMLQDRLYAADSFLTFVLNTYPDLHAEIFRRYSWDLMLLYNECTQRTDCTDIQKAIVNRMKKVNPHQVGKRKTAILHWLFLNCRWIYNFLFKVKNTYFSEGT